MSTTLDLDAIKARAEALDPSMLTPVTGQHPSLTALQLSAADVPALVAEIERMRAEDVEEIPDDLSYEEQYSERP